MLHLVFRNFHAAGTTHRTASFYGPGTGPIAVSSVACTGAETRLIDCTSSTPSRCTHAHDAGVKCMLQTGRYMVKNFEYSPKVWDFFLKFIQSKWVPCMTTITRGISPLPPPPPPPPPGWMWHSVDLCIKNFMKLMILFPDHFLASDWHQFRATILFTINLLCPCSFHIPLPASSILICIIKTQPCALEISVY